jgi:hypothetical protein
MPNSSHPFDEWLRVARIDRISELSDAMTKSAKLNQRLKKRVKRLRIRLSTSESTIDVTMGK